MLKSITCLASNIREIIHTKRFQHHNSHGNTAVLNDNHINLPLYSHSTIRYHGITMVYDSTIITISSWTDSIWNIKQDTVTESRAHINLYIASLYQCRCCSGDRMRDADRLRTSAALTFNAKRTRSSVKRVYHPPIQTLVVRCEERVRSGHSHAARVSSSPLLPRDFRTERLEGRTRARRHPRVITIDHQ